MAGRLQGKQVLITGSSSGVGLELARRFASEGAIVALHSHLSREQCAETNQPPIDGCNFFQQDLTKLDELPDFIKRVWESLSGIDVLVCNAGTYNEPDFLELTADTLLRIHTLNFFAPVLLINEWAKLCVAHGVKGKAICTSSINARLSEPCHVAYDSSKAALEGAIRAIAIDLAKHGITIVGVALGLLRTPLTAPFIDAPGVMDQLRQRIILGVTAVEDVAGTYVFLSSDDAKAITGTTFAVDGGISGTQSTIGVEPVT